MKNAHNFSKEAKNISIQEQINRLYKLSQINIAAIHLAGGSTSSSGKEFSHSAFKEDFR